MPKNLSSQKGFVTPAFIFTLFVLAVIGSGLLFVFYNSYSTSRPNVLAASNSMEMVAGEVLHIVCNGTNLDIEREHLQARVLCGGKSEINSYEGEVLLSRGEKLKLTCEGDKIDAVRTSNVVKVSCVDGEDSDGDEDTEEDDDDGTESDGDTSGDGFGLPFGPFHLPTQNYGVNSPITYNSAFLNLEKTSLTDSIAHLESAKSKGMKIMISIPGAGARYKDANRHYVYDNPSSTQDFVGQIDRLATLDLAKYYQDGVILGNIIMDEPQDASNWGGTPVTVDQVKQAALYVKSKWPTVPVGVYSTPTYIKAGTWSSKDLDFLANNFKKEKLCSGSKAGCYGTTKEAWLSGFLTDVKSAKLGLWHSINVIYGGSGGSAMTAAEVQEYGEYFTKNDGGYGCGLTLWTWDARDLDRNADGKGYFSESDNPGITKSLEAVATASESHKSDVVCKYH